MLAFVNTPLYLPSIGRTSDWNSPLRGIVRCTVFKYEQNVSHMNWILLSWSLVLLPVLLKCRLCSASKKTAGLKFFHCPIKVFCLMSTCMLPYKGLLCSQYLWNALAAILQSYQQFLLSLWLHSVRLEQQREVRLHYQPKDEFKQNNKN